MKILAPALLLFALPAFAQTATAPGMQPWTMKDSLLAAYTAYAPQNPVWSPDSKYLTYLDRNEDLLAVDATTGKVSVLVSAARLESVMNPKINEKDRDHRSRYHTAEYHFSPDASHILFDAGGELWNYDLKTATGRDLGSTGAGSGDDPKYAPNAAYISYVKDHNLFVRSMDGTGERNLSNTTDAAILNGEVDWVYEEELDTRSNYYWAPDSKHLAYLEANETKVPQYPLVDWSGVHTTTEMQRYPQPGDPNPDVRIGVVSVAGGTTRWITLPISGGNDYIPRFGWVNANTVWIETLLRDHKHLTIYFADIRTGAVKPALALTDDKFFDESYDVTFLTGSPEFLLTSWSDGYTHIYRYKYDAAAPVATGATLENEVEQGPYEVADISGVDEAAKTIYYTSNETDPREHQLWAVNYDGSNKHRVTTTHGYNKATVAPNGRNFVDEASDVTVAPTMSMCTVAGHCTQYWQAPALQHHVLRVPEYLTLKAADGTTTIYASLLLPANATGTATVPMINEPYGGPHAQTVNFRYGGSIFQDNAFADAGFAVLHVDNRGMGERGRDFEQAAYHNFEPVQFADQQAAIDQVLATHAVIDGKRLGWQGWSWGGTFTLYAMTHSDRFRAGVEGGPVTDWRNYDSIYTERYLGLPSENADLYNRFSVKNFAGDLKGHVLLVHGTLDDNVHIQNTIQFVGELVKHDVHYDMQIYPGVTHSLGGYAEHVHFYEAMLNHFETYLK